MKVSKQSDVGNMSNRKGLISRPLSVSLEIVKYLQSPKAF